MVSGFCRFAAPVALVTALALAGCGGGGSSAGGEADDDLGDLVLIDVNVGGTDGVALNQVIVFEFSEEVVGSSVSPATMQIRLSPANAWQVPGEYNMSGNIVEFFPQLPTMPDLSNSGLKPGRTYEIRLPGHPNPNTVTNADGDPLPETVKVSFATAVAASPNLFIDYNPDDQPHVTSVNPRDGALNVPQSVIPEVTFSEPLHPSTVTVSNVTLTMTHRPPGNELDPSRPIQGSLVFEQSRESVVLRFVSEFPLADNATYLLHIDRRVSDLAGNDLVGFESSFTIRDEPPVPGEFALDFGDGTEKWEDTDVTIASWNGDIPGTLCGIFTAGAGTGVDGDFDPSGNTSLNSDVKDTWNFRSFKIKSGVKVTLLGEKPITILSLAKMEIAGTLDASGANGGRGETNTYNTAVPRNPGGKGGPGGGKGGDAATYDGPGGDGEDGYNTVGTGAEGPDWPSAYATYRISTTGGSGGGHRTVGKAGTKGPYTYYTPPTPGKPGGTDGNQYCDPLTGGGGGSSGTLVHQGTYTYNGAGSGGGGGGGLELRSASNIEITGSVLAEGGDGGAPGSTYMASPGGGAAGGALLFRSLQDLVIDGGTISVEGGTGHTSGFYTYYTGASGDGGHGWIRMEDGDSSPTLTNATIEPSTMTTGTFVATGAGAPSIGQTLWMNMGVFDPVFLSAEVIQVLQKDGQKIKVEIQATVEDIFDFGMPDLDKTSAWTDIASIKSLNGKGYSFIRFRVTFTLANDQEFDDPQPYVDLIKIKYQY